MQFQLEIKSLQDGYHIIRTELGKSDLEDSVLLIPINTFQAIYNFMSMLERDISSKMFKIVEKQKSMHEYKLIYETVPMLE